MSTPETAEHGTIPPQALHDCAFLADHPAGAGRPARGDHLAVRTSLAQRRGLLHPHRRNRPLRRHADGPARARRRTLEEMLIWRSRWVTGDGIVESRVLAGAGEARPSWKRCPSGDAGGDDQGAGWCCATARVRPNSVDARRDDDGVWTARAGDLHLRRSGGGDASLSEVSSKGGQLTLDPASGAGQWHDLVLELSEFPLWTPPPGPVHVVVPHRTRLVGRRTRAGQHGRRSRRTAGVRRAARRDQRRRGMVAAATTSLPERSEEGRNYDYRYAWIRDQCFAGQAVAAAGQHPLLDEAVRFAGTRLHEDGPKLKPACTVAGGPGPDQRTLELQGYPGGFDRIGNHVSGQFQLDVFGEALLLLPLRGLLPADDPRRTRAALLRGHPSPNSGHSHVTSETNRTSMNQQTVVITGASAGNGRATARLFAGRGANVVLLARGKAGLDATADDVGMGGRALVVPTDMADPTQVEAAAVAAEEAFGPIDVWVNNAFTSVFAPFMEIEPAEYKRVTEVSYLGFVHGTGPRSSA